MIAYCRKVFKTEATIPTGKVQNMKKNIRDRAVYGMFNVVIAVVAMDVADNFIPASRNISPGFWFVLLMALATLSTFTLGRWLWKGWKRVDAELARSPEPRQWERTGKERAERAKNWNL